MKVNQYSEMWSMVLTTMPTEQRALHLSQPQDREVAELFLTSLCPDFHADPMRFLAPEVEPDDS